jgi:ABC-type transporter Mla subunit MlaD
MLEEWIVVTAGVVIIIIALCATYLLSAQRERRAIRERYKLTVYADLLNAVTGLNVSSGDTYRLGQAKMALARTLNRLNLVASPGVLKHVNELLDFMNECTDGEYDQLKELNILNQIVRAVRRDLDPADAKVLEDSGFRFKFYSPPRV